MARILLTGGNGQVGWELQRALAPLGEIAAPGRGAMDLSSPDAIRRVIRETQPEIIVNAAGYTAVDKAEAEPDLALQVNGVAPGVMAGEAGRIGALLVHYSTDYVFDGAKNGPYSEGDPANPASSYGRSKLAGEEAILAAGAPYLILRTSWVYAARGNNFVRTMLRLARERAEVKVVNDQVGAPTWARTIADMTAQILGASAAKRLRPQDISGTYHLAAAGAVSWFGFAGAIFAEAETRIAGFKAPALVPIPTSAYPLPARRPANSRLDTAKFAAAFGLKPPPWNADLAQCIQEIAEGSGK